MDNKLAGAPLESRTKTPAVWLWRRTVEPVFHVVLRVECLELQPPRDLCNLSLPRKPTVGRHGGEVNDAGDGDDQEADDDGGDRHVERHPAQPPGAVVVSPRVAVPGLGERERDAVARQSWELRRSTQSEVF